MAVQAGVVWVRPPAELARALELYGNRALAAVGAIAERTAGGMQNDARRNAPWTDRTGNARSGLFGMVGREGPVFRIVLGHTMFYGVYLELSNGARYAIIMPTIEGALPELERMLQGLFR